MAKRKEKTYWAGYSRKDELMIIDERLPIFWYKHNARRLGKNIDVRKVRIVEVKNGK